MASRFGGVGVSLPLNQLGANGFALQAGAVMYVPPGTFNVRHGQAATVQTFDPILGVWRPCGADGGNWEQVDSDGNNYRIANQTGCPVAALLTNAGSGYTTPPTVTPSAGGSTWTAIMGQVVSSVTVTNGGSNYQYPPIVIIQSPGFPGIQADGYCTISGGIVTSVTLFDQGGGYNAPPFITFFNDPRDTLGNGAQAVPVLGGSGTVNGVVCTNHGTPLTSLPTLAFSGGGGTGAVAVPIMDWAVTAYVVAGGGAGYATPVEVTTLGTGIPTTATAYTNPSTQANFLRTQPALFVGAVTGGAIVAAGQTLLNSGHIGGIASNISTIVIGGAAPSGAASFTLTVGGVNDFTWIQQG